MANPFQTPPNQLSFSSLIDDAILATGKPGSLLTAIQQGNLTIRECQGLGLFARDLIEDQLTVTSTPFTWNRPPFFRRLRTCSYGVLDPSGMRYNIRYPKFLLPGKIQKNEYEYYYAANNYFVFSGANLSDIINTATYYWSTPLTYYALAGQSTSQYPGGPYTNRPAYYDNNLGRWMYLLADNVTYAATTGDPVKDAAQQALSGNWLTEDWRPLILSGTKAKIWNSVGDPRGNVEYSLYKQNQLLLRVTSGYEAEGF